MNSRKLGLSIKYKLLLVLTGLPLVTLSLYLWLATSLFEKDKMAYIYDSGVTLSRTVASQIHSELVGMTDALLPILTQYDPLVGKLKDEANNIFKKQKKVLFVSFYRNINGNFEKTVRLSKGESYDQHVATQSKMLSVLLKEAITQGIVVRPLPGEPSIFMMAVSDSQKINTTPPIEGVSDIKETKSNTVIFFLGYSTQIQDVLNSSSTFMSYLVDNQGSLYLRPTKDRLLDTSEMSLNYFFEPRWAEVPEGTAEYGQSRENAILASFAKVGIGDLKVISIIRKESALSAGKELLIKSLYCFVMLFAATVLLSIFASGGLTSTISELYQATKEVADGKFDIHLAVRSTDEVGGLTESFNHMAKEVSRLLQESAEKARMASELETAKTVQETLFPAKAARFGGVEISGYYQPASECGGDWWHYCEIGNFVFLWIGDATGHGAPAALITSAARSAASIIEILKDVNPSQALQIINTAIHSTSKGKMMMTFFIAAIDKTSGDLFYANASHEFPFILRNKRPLEKADLEMLDTVNGPRLGHSIDSVYPEGRTKLNPGDIVLFYTDGIPELKGKEGKNFGERRYVKALMEATQKEVLDDMVLTIHERIEEFRQNSPLEDDVTFFAVRFNGAVDSSPVDDDKTLATLEDPSAA